MDSSSRLRTHHVLIEKVNDHVSQAAVAPVSMNQEEFLQVLEVRNGEIARHGRLERMKSFRQDPVAKEDLKTSLQTCMPSCPEIPMPISAAWIMLTSLAPSPKAKEEEISRGEKWGEFNYRNQQQVFRWSCTGLLSLISCKRFRLT